MTFFGHGGFLRARFFYLPKSRNFPFFSSRPNPMPKNPKRRTLIQFAILQTVYIALLPFWPHAVGYTGRNFAEGFSMETLFFVLPIWPYPVIVLGCLGYAWWLYRKQQFKTARVMNGIPFPFALAMAAAASMFGFVV